MAYNDSKLCKEKLYYVVKMCAKGHQLMMKDNFDGTNLTFQLGEFHRVHLCKSSGRQTGCYLG